MRSRGIATKVVQIVDYRLPIVVTDLRWNFQQTDPDIATKVVQIVDYRLPIVVTDLRWNFQQTDPDRLCVLHREGRSGHALEFAEIEVALPPNAAGRRVAIRRLSASQASV